MCQIDRTVPAIRKNKDKEACQQAHLCEFGEHFSASRKSRREDWGEVAYV